MNRLTSMFSLLCTITLSAQKIDGNYILKTKIANDSIVSEIALNDSTFIKKDYIEDKTNHLENYKSWRTENSKGKIKKNKSFYFLSEYNGEKLISTNIVKISRRKIKFYGHKPDDLSKLVRCKRLTYIRASL